MRAGKVVLLLDTSESRRHVLQTVLQVHGYRVIAPAGVEHLTALAVRMADCLLVCEDCGYANRTLLYARKLRRDLRTVLLYAITSEGAEPNVAERTLTKDASAAEILQTVHQMVQRKRGPQPARLLMSEAA